MKLLVLGSDPSILNPDSAMAVRTMEYGAMVDKYTVIVAADKDKSQKLSEQVTAYGLHARFKFFLWLKIYFFAARLLRSEKYDLISSPDAYYLGLVSLWLGRHFALPVQVQVHGWEKHNFIRKNLARYVLKRAAGVRVVSQRLKNQLIEVFCLPAEKIITIPIYVDFSIKQPAKVSVTARSKTSFIFLTVSRLVKVKNIPLQIKAMKALQEKYPSVELWLVGDGPEKNNLERLVKELKLESAVKFWGWQRKTDEFYRQADGFLLTSDSEGWGMAIIEAASYQLPIIMTDVGCAGEVINNNKSGLVVPVGQINPLIHAMEKILTNPELGRKLGLEAATAISRLPDFKQTLSLYLEGWQGILNKNL